MRPPLRRCRACGGHHYAWSENDVCGSCQPEVRENRSELAAIVRQQRLARRSRVSALTPDPNQGEGGTHHTTTNRKDSNNERED